ncbi:hypothetical protein P152DRAFT_461129 [Eremomyces bilateralis CBS 781.70]|uniref:MYND-type domain-containing protein n=1 Tax=Eremomyces bilateralis CBS 781.70 TaxID=1392243 RepID=A0A6G1FVP9_9PEZI|nr:uncharacterized protein P152DRAFT_461129 [Eremomyces bilateralis CBS 781.70]KAF1809741.1 hypothetical protein P152DRAFT_461129 [Eremomyces bilateralis CBS 781.70]
MSANTTTTTTPATETTPRSESNEAPKCAKCEKTGPETTSGSLLTCSRCRSTKYCSKACQKADWKTHKRSCGPNGPTNTSSSSSSGRRVKGLQVAIDKPFHALHSKTWLHNRPKEDTYRLLIDCFRLRQEDDYKFSGEFSMETEDGASGRPFRRFLAKAKSRNGVLPPWWTAQDDEDVLSMGLSRNEEWARFNAGVEKSDIIERYGNPQMPMQLRLLGEQIIGSGPGGMGGEHVIQLQMQIEAGELYGSMMGL